MVARGLVLVAYMMFGISFVFQSVPAAVGGAVLAFLAFVAAHSDPGGIK